MEMTDGKQELLIGTRQGKAIRFSEENVREMGRGAHGVRAVSLAKKDEVIDMETIINEVALLRNRWLGVMKGIESKNFMLGHVVRLRTAGMEDIVVS